MRHRFVFQRALTWFWTARLRAQAYCLFACAVWACRSVDKGSAMAAASTTLARGDHVVVEPRAAEFFEARVLSIGKSQLRVEPAGKHEGISVALSDVYPLEPASSPPKPGQFAICKVDGRWLGCRVEQAYPDGIDVRTLQGDALRASTSALLIASPTTELNLRRAFGRLSSSAAFAAAAARAGRPITTPGYRVTPRSRVVALRAGGWFSGVVSDVQERGAHIAFAPDNVSDQIPIDDIVPEPPASAAPGRGDFALVRPPSPAEPWQVMKVVGPEERDFKVVGADAVVRVVTSRDLLPLGPSAASDAR
jgi:hypothetical protein